MSYLKTFDSQINNSYADSKFSTASSSQKAAGLNRETQTLVIHSAEEFLYMSFGDKKAFLESILCNDVKAGFLLAFCDSQYCSENARFVVAVNKYCDCFDGSSNWKSWEGLDKQKVKEPENRIFDEQCRNIERELHFISENFLTSSGTYEICISPSVLKRTKMRMENFRVYGPETFVEASIDPINTLMKDILPRFVVSQIYADMLFFVDKINNVAFVHTQTLELPHPLDPQLQGITVDADYISNFDNYTEHPLLYDQLLKYLNRIVSSENLLCIRAIDMFQLLFSKHGQDRVPMGNIVSSAAAMSFTSVADVIEAEKSISHIEHTHVKADKLKSMAVTQAWLVYLHFLAVNSPLEVCTDHYMLQNVAQTMAAPSKHMFRKVRNACLHTVQQHFMAFKNTNEYAEIPLLLAAAAAATEADAKAEASSKACTIS